MINKKTILIFLALIFSPLVFALEDIPCTIDVENQSARFGALLYIYHTKPSAETTVHKMAIKPRSRRVAENIRLQIGLTYRYMIRLAQMRTDDPTAFDYTNRRAPNTIQFWRKIGTRFARRISYS